MTETLETQVAAYLDHRMPAARDVEVFDLSRIHGGASRETYRLRARWQEEGAQKERPLIVRRDPVASLIETERDLEYRAYQAFYPVEGVPVPEPLYLEEETRWLERPFFVMEQIEECEAASPFADQPFGDKAAKVGAQFWDVLGRIAGADVEALKLNAFMVAPKPEETWAEQLSYWEKVIDEDELTPQPVARAAIRWMRRNPPPPAQKISMVHGDYRNGNFLFNEAGEIRAILDWEMCHLGDPLEDLAWAADPLWAGTTPDLPGSMVTKAEAIALWEKESGLTADPVSLRWWEIFVSLKGLAIWISAGQEYQSGSNGDPINAFSSWVCTDRHNRLLAERLSAFAGGA